MLSGIDETLPPAGLVPGPGLGVAGGPGAGLLSVAGIALVLVYRLDRRTHAGIMAHLAARRGATASAAG